MNNSVSGLICLISTVVVAVHPRLMAGIPINVSTPLPASVDNSTSAAFPPVIRQEGESCGNAVGIGYVFNYEINSLRGTTIEAAEDLFTYFYTYAFLNGGEEQVEFYYRHFLAAWIIAEENGIPVAGDYGTSNLGATRWLDGYDNYYRAMRNRVAAIDSLRISDAASLDTMKQWLVDRGNGSPDGGVMVLTANIYCCAETTVPAGSEGAGDSFLKAWGWSSDPADERRCRTSPHALTIVGYNDSVRYDYNGDGKFTNGSSVGEWEIGALKVVNSWGTAAWDNGYIWVGYRTLALPMEEGGTRNDNYVYYMTGKKEYSPRLTLKATITSRVRDNLSLSVGAAPDRDADAPTVTRRFERQFNYAGGSYPMQGNRGASSLEIGLDISDLIDSLGNIQEATFFLIVSSKGGTATVDALSLMDYTGDSLVETPYAEENVPIPAGTENAPEVTLMGIGAPLQEVATAHRLPASGRRRKMMHLIYRGRVTEVPLPVTGAVRCLLHTTSGRLHASLPLGNSANGIRLPAGLAAGTWVVTLAYPDHKSRSCLITLQR